MPSISTERLSGIVAAAFFIRATEALISTIQVAVLPKQEAYMYAGSIIQALVAVVVPGFLGYKFLRPHIKKWVHIAGIVVFALSGCMAILNAIVPFYMNSPSNIGFMKISMFGKAIIELSVSLILIMCVTTIMKRTKIEQGSGAT